MKQATSYDNDLERTEQRTGGLVLFLGEEGAAAAYRENGPPAGGGWLCDDSTGNI